MANANAPTGFEPVFTMSGSEAAVHEYTVDSSNAAAMAAGDLVLFEADGNCAIYADSGTTAVVGCIGVFASCRYTDSTGHLRYSSYLPASTAATILVYDDPLQEFSVQCDAGGSVAIDSSLIGENFNILASQTPIQIGPSGHSRMQLDTSTHGTLTTVTCHATRLLKKPDNVYSATESTSRYARLVVRILNHFNSGAAPASGLAAGI